MKIVIFTQSPVSKAPRVVKEANCLVNYGFEVIVFSLWCDKKILDADLRLLSHNILYKAGVSLLSKNFKTFFLRIELRFYRELVKYFKIQTKRSLGYGYSSYLTKLRDEKADLYIGHQEMSMPLAKELKESGHKIAFDFEDYHSHDLLPRDRRFRPIKLLMFLEGYLLNNAEFCTTTSDTMAKELASKYCSKVPVTIYNSFRKNKEYPVIREKSNTNSLVWISQVIGPGRGLELIIEAVMLSKYNFELTLIGSKDEKYCEGIQSEQYDNLIVKFSDYIAADQISNELSNYDLGIAFEELSPLSRNFTITNKIFHYLASGIAIIATNTKGQIEISNKTENTIAIVSHDPKSIAAVLDKLFSDRNRLEKIKEKSKFYGESIFCFENEEKKIIGLVNSVL